MRELVRKLIWFPVVLLVSVVVGYLLIVAACKCSDEKIIRHSSESTDAIVYLYTTEDRVWMNWPDYYTDLVMLNIASYNGTGGSAFYRAASNDQLGTLPFAIVKWLDEQCPQENKVYREYSEADPSEDPMPYGKYWNGYLVFLRPLLAAFNYLQISDIFYNLLLGLMILTAVLLLIKDRAFVIPFALAFLTLRPISKFCITYAIMEILLLVFLDITILNKRIRTSAFAGGMFFFVMGIVSVYFTLLQFTFVIPLFVAVYLALSERIQNRTLAPTGRLIVHIGSYSAGFCSMWACKWVVLALFAPNGISYLIESIRIRSSSSDGEEVIHMKDVLLWNGCGFYYQNDAWMPCVLAFAVCLVFALVAAVIVRRKEPSAKIVSWNDCFAVFITAAAVLTRYGLLLNHSRIHYFFMNRLLSAVVFAVLAFVFAILGRCIRILWARRKGQGKRNR